MTPQFVLCDIEFQIKSVANLALLMSILLHNSFFDNKRIL